jgi:hypothetical protein
MRVMSEKWTEYVRLLVFVAVTTNKIIVWIMVPYSLIEFRRASRRINNLYAASYFLGLLFYPEDGGVTFPRMVNVFLPDYPTSLPRLYLL